MFRCVHYFVFFFFNDTATTEIYTLSLHDALPICAWRWLKPSRSIVNIVSRLPGLSAGPRLGRSSSHQPGSPPELACSVLWVAKRSFWDWLSVTAKMSVYFVSKLPPSLLAVPGALGARRTLRLRRTIRVAA